MLNLGNDVHGCTFNFTFNGSYATLDNNLSSIIELSTPALNLSNDIGNTNDTPATPVLLTFSDTVNIKCSSNFTLNYVANPFTPSQSSSDVIDAHYSATGIRVKQFLTIVLILSCCIVKSIINMKLPTSTQRDKFSSSDLFSVKVSVVLNPHAKIFEPLKKWDRNHFDEVPPSQVLNPNAMRLNPKAKSFLPSKNDALLINEASTSIESSSGAELFFDSNSDEGDHYAESLLNKMRLQNLNKLIIAHLNINSIRGKFEALKTFVKNNLDILVVSETKLDHTFPFNQFFMEGYRLIRHDRKINGQYGGGVMVFIREDIPCKEIKFPGNEVIESIFFEINLRSTK